MRAADLFYMKSCDKVWSGLLFLVVYYTEAGVSENEASAEHETSQLYKYYTFLLLSQLFYQCYGINTAIDILYEYKWSLLFFTRRGGVSDVF